MGRTGSLDRVEALVSPDGIVSRAWARLPAHGLASFRPWVALLGSGLPERTRGLAPGLAHDFAGAGIDPDDLNGGCLIAIAGAPERYISGDFLGEPVRQARASELDGAIVGPTSMPRCSEAELAADACPLLPFDPDATIRWVRVPPLIEGADYTSVTSTQRLQKPS
jgi:ribosomal protein S12 methylthiotransferase accessory factor